MLTDSRRCFRSSNILRNDYVQQEMEKHQRAFLDETVPNDERNIGDYHRVEKVHHLSRDPRLYWDPLERRNFGEPVSPFQSNSSCAFLLSTYMVDANFS
jgi:hypothetical protein